MKKHLSSLSLLTFTSLFLTGAFSARADYTDQADEIAKGHYQSVIGDCMACHTKPGGAPFAGGAPLQTPFGALVPPNITPDVETGIGAWSLEDFTRMMKTGIGHKGIRLYPAMPYPNYTLMPENDIAALWAYMKTVQPVENKVEANQLPFPLNIRLLMSGWNMINFSQTDFKPDPNQSEEWNRGAYLVQGPGHCGTCHTPKSMLGADKTSQALQGAALQGWYAPNITNNSHVGLGGWDEADVVKYLKDGANRFTIASGPMAEAVEHSTSKMTDSDIKAIAVYLKNLSDNNGKAPAPLAADSREVRNGARIYHDNCSACHGGNGEGAAYLFPALANSSIVQQPNTETLAHIVLAGSQAVHTPTAPTTPAMPSLAWRLNDQQVADVLTFIRNSWGNAAAKVSPSDVASVRAASQ